MATITLTIPDAQVQRVIDALATSGNYAAYVAGGGALTQAQFARQQIVLWLKTVVKDTERWQAAKTASEQADAAASPDITA
jgi:hypothetical protein